MFRKLKTRTTVATITAVAAITGASVLGAGAAAPTIGTGLAGTPSSRSGPHHIEVADTIWGQVGQSAIQAATPTHYNLINIWPSKLSGPA